MITTFSRVEDKTILCKTAMARLNFFADKVSLIQAQNNEMKIVYQISLKYVYCSSSRNWGL
jgi:hypothetical protein